MSKETGSPAFPVPYSSYGKGMSLRDYFAAKAMQGDMASQPLSPGATDEGLAEFAGHYYRIADAMIAARSK